MPSLRSGSVLSEKKFRSILSRSEAKANKRKIFNFAIFIAKLRFALLALLQSDIFLRFKMANSLKINFLILFNSIEQLFKKH